MGTQSDQQLIYHHFLSRYSPQLEISNICNIKCNYCSNPFLKVKKGIMEPLMFYKIMGNFLEKITLNRITICGFGEPFCNPNIYEYIDWLSNQSLSVFIQTNGKWKLDRSKLDQLLCSKHISWTIDAVTNETFHLSRPDTDVRQIWSNLKNIIELRNASSSNTELSVRMNVFTFNHHVIEPLVTKCLDMGVDHVFLAHGYGPKEVMTTIEPKRLECLPSGYVTVQEDLLTSTSANHPEMEKMVDESPEADHDRAQRHPESGDFLPQSHGTPELTVEGEQISKKPLKRRSSNFFLAADCPHLTVRWNGLVTPCCYDYDMTIQLGDLTKETLDKILTKDRLDPLSKDIWSLIRKRTILQNHIPCSSCYLYHSLFPNKYPLVKNSAIFDIKSKWTETDIHNIINESDICLIAIRNEIIDDILVSMDNKHNYPQNNIFIIGEHNTPQNIIKELGSLYLYPYGTFKTDTQSIHWINENIPENLNSCSLLRYSDIPSDSFIEFADLIGVNQITDCEFVRYVQ